VPAKDKESPTPARKQYHTENRKYTIFVHTLSNLFPACFGNIIGGKIKTDGSGWKFLMAFKQIIHTLFVMNGSEKRKNLDCSFPFYTHNAQ